MVSMHDSHRELESEDHIARLQHLTYIFPPTMSEANLDPRLQILSLTHIF